VVHTSEDADAQGDGAIVVHTSENADAQGDGAIVVHTSENADAQGDGAIVVHTAEATDSGDPRKDTVEKHSKRKRPESGRYTENLDEHIVGMAQRGAVQPPKKKKKSNAQERAIAITADNAEGTATQGTLLHPYSETINRVKDAFNNGESIMTISKGIGTHNTTNGSMKYVGVKGKQIADHNPYTIVLGALHAARISKQDIHNRIVTKEDRSHDCLLRKLEKMGANW